ncbi:carboxymuconolactone decarboxylase family protein [Rhodococcus opacus]|uniref:carboxymuconolactone decarboxylase family protein n=1 Tax=Rhodococcus opacus TaxID=37919 RepID=UPI0027E156E1|nr:carboxymuconolactone decarboxylase family protein [Rhodococcus opacus]
MALRPSRLITAALASVSILASACTADAGDTDDSTNTLSRRRTPTGEDIGKVSPGLQQYANNVVVEGLWSRPGLSPRDRSVVTVSALIARNNTVEMPQQITAALDHGVEPRELSEIITHLAFYSGWGNAMSAVAITNDIYTERGIATTQLATPARQPLPLDEAAEARRADTVEQDFGTVSPGVVQYTTDVLFRDLWLRPELAPRDRSLVTVSALVASGQVAQIPFHLGRAMDNGLTQEEAGEALTQLAFYAGWPSVFSALPVAREVFAGRP